MCYGISHCVTYMTCMIQMHDNYVKINENIERIPKTREQVLKILSCLLKDLSNI